MAGPNTVEFNDANFESEVLQSQQPVLVDFWAEWCMPCKALGPVIDELAKDYTGKIKVGKVDTDANKEVSVHYGISSIPTVILFKDGQIKDRFVGLRNKKDFVAALENLLQAK
ncbi:MAG: Thioredoxin C-1 [Phycisphaerae bacterium]|nr:Thioredoxin C-1 [Phycisphaerae bacterium]